jgi:thioredoxin-related protein
MTLAKQHILVLLTGVLLVIGAAYAFTRDATEAAEPDAIDNSTVKIGKLIFQTDLGTVLEQAKAENKMIYIYGMSEFCGWCKKFEAESLSDERIMSILNEHFILVRVDTVKQRDLAANLGIRGTPASIFTTSDGQEISGSRIPGYLDHDSFYKHLNGLIDAEE